MRTLILLVVVLSLSVPVFSQRSQNAQWRTDYELSGYTRTPRYRETIAYCRKLAQASPWVHYTSFGASPQGRDLPLLIVSRDRAFTPSRASLTGKAVVLVQSGIHAGEIDGKDASLMLLRDIVITKRHARLLDHTIVLVVPIFNVDGHERFGRYNRINQNGPEETGWRVSAQNLNLNRDYMKADTPEMRAMLTLFNAWLPDFFVDCHVTDGADFQYDITYTMETAQNIDREISMWITRDFLPKVLPAVEAAGHRIFDYVAPRTGNDLRSGLRAGVTSPRLSTGYASIQNRPSMLIETHMLKPYRTRVDATYHMLRSVLEAVNSDAGTLRALVRRADDRTIRAVHDSRGSLPLQFALANKSETRRFLGFKERTEKSDVSGGTWTIYTSEPEEFDVQYFNEMTVTDSVSIPVAYLVPREWRFVPDILKLHGVKIEETVDPVTSDVQSYTFSDVSWRNRPYEGRHGATYEVKLVHERREYPAGTIVVRTNQRAAKVAVHLLEPRSADSFVAWGFFDAIFEQKEYAEAYVMEREARDMLAADALLRKEFEQKLASDSTFANDSGARLNWFYLRSKWADPLMNKYPVARSLTDVQVRTRLWKE